MRKTPGLPKKNNERSKKHKRSSAQRPQKRPQLVNIKSFYKNDAVLTKPQKKDNNYYSR